MMPVYSRCEDALTCKLVSFYPGNAKHGKPTHLATIMLYDPMYGELKAVSVNVAFVVNYFFAFHRAYVMGSSFI